MFDVTARDKTIRRSNTTDIWRHRPSVPNSSGNWWKIRPRPPPAHSASTSLLYYVIVTSLSRHACTNNTRTAWRRCNPCKRIFTLCLALHAIVA